MQGCGDLGRSRVSRQAAQGGKGLQTSWHLGHTVGVHRPASALMTRVESHEEVPQFGTSHLSQDDPIGPHAQALPHQVREGDGTFALGIGGPSLHRHPVRMVYPDLPGIFDDDQPLIRWQTRQHCRQQGRLAGSGASSHQEGQLADEDLVDDLSAPRGHRSPGHPIVEGQVTSRWHAQAETGSRSGQDA